VVTEREAEAVELVGFGPKRRVEVKEDLLVVGSAARITEHIERIRLTNECNPV
jgi:hypothetical protein